MHFLITKELRLFIECYVHMQGKNCCTPYNGKQGISFSQTDGN